jgi:glycosyltransferase involved in cell wall biosynthesis
MNPSLQLIAANTQVQELDLMAQADVTVVVSPFEQTVLAERTASNVVVVPNIHAANSHPADPTGRDGLLFVGGFSHTPNVDAIVWFVRDVLPLISESAPHVHLTIVGSDPTPAILELASDSVTVAGWVPDTMSLYESARIAIAPLRYGAGVKGKVGEALGFGVPMVVTSIASEGMHIEDRKHALVSDTGEEFAKSILELMSDDLLWRRISDAGQELIHEHFGIDATRELVEQALSVGMRTHEYAGVR